jgi:hypothetical protein
VHQQKVGWAKVERISNPEQKIDDFLSQELASKIMGSNLRDNGSEVGLGFIRKHSGDHSHFTYHQNPVEIRAK